MAITVTDSMYAEFEQKLRQEICNAALALNKSSMGFAVFSDTKCNEKYWIRTSNGGFRLKSSPDYSPADAIRDIFMNGWQYATECATAMAIVYYKALSEVYGDELFNKTFPSIYLMDWDIRNPLLSKTGRMEKLQGQSELLSGDRGYFANPDHDPALPQWQGENVIVLDNGMYYGHGIGYSDSIHIINALNSRRGDKSNARSAYLMAQAGRPDFKKLADVMYRYQAGNAVTVWKVFPPAVGVIGIEGKSGTRVFV